MNFIPNSTRDPVATAKLSEADGFDDIVSLAAQICDVANADLSVAEGDRQVVKAHCGREPVGARAATGFSWRVPLLSRDGRTLGTLGLSDPRPRDLADPQAMALRTLAGQAATQLELREAVQAAREEASHHRLILESATDFVIITLDPKGRLTSWNEGARRVLGWTEDEILGRSADLLFTDEDRANGVLETEMATALQDGRGLDERWHRRRDNSLFWASGEMLPLLGEDGARRGFLKILRDRTVQHEAGVALERSMDALRESEAQLRQAQKLEAIGRLAAGVAHDFNNILQGVSGGLELVLDEVAPGTVAHECATIALGSARRGAALTNHLLSYARKQMLQPQPLEIPSYLQGMKALLTRTLGPHIAVIVRVDQQGPLVNADPLQLKTALLNLAINAADAMPKGGTLTLESRQACDAQGRPFVVITTTDTGTGMDAATLAKAFDPFFTTKGLEGTGLGLSMVQGFAEQSGGTTRISSTPREGTSVELWLPAIAREAPVLSATTRVMPHGCGRILLVDDAPDVLTTAAASLERAGFAVVRANGADQALAALAGEQFDLIVSDYAMPGCNGVDLIDRARKIVPGLPAVIITGFAEVEATDVAIVRKPFERQQLLEVMLGEMKQNR